jgi:hypothetical protein
MMLRYALVELPVLILSNVSISGLSFNAVL